ncbi:MAG: hypothetical protein AAFN81_05620 [Bacteroidota bacterium]
MVIIVNGAIGTGKTAVAWELLNLFERAVMLDGDYFAALQPFSIFTPSDLAYVYEGLAHHIKFHCDHGFEHFIINYVFETGAELEKLEGFLPEIVGPVYKCLLHCQQNERDRRIRKRNNEDIEWEITRSAQLTEILQNSNRDGSLGPQVDTTTLSVQEVAQRVFSLTNNKNQKA